MPARVKRKHLKVDPLKISRVRKALGAKTETEAIEKALDLVLAEEEIRRTLDRIGGKGAIERIF